MTNENSLYALSNAVATVIEGGYVFDEETGEIFWSPEELDELELALEEKAEACAVVRKNKLAFVKAIDEEIKALQERKKAVEAQAKRLDDYIVSCLDITGGAIETPKCKLSIRKSEQVDVIDEDSIPRKFMREVVTYKPNKLLIKKEIKSGNEVPGTALVVNRNLQVK